MGTVAEDAYESRLASPAGRGNGGINRLLRARIANMARRYEAPTDRLARLKRQLAELETRRGLRCRAMCFRGKLQQNIEILRAASRCSNARWRARRFGGRILKTTKTAGCIGCIGAVRDARGVLQSTESRPRDSGAISRRRPRRERWGGFRALLRRAHPHAARRDGLVG